MKNNSETSSLIENGEKKKSLSQYGSNYLSASAFDTLNREAMKIRSRSFCSNDNLQSSASILENDSRRALYGTLPFMAAYGMQYRENNVRRIISKASTDALVNLEPKSKFSQVLSDIDVDEIIITFHLIMAVLIAMLSQFLIGYNTGVMNAPSSVVFPNHTISQWSLAVAAFAIGGPGGAILGGLLANRNGRRGAILINSWIFLVGGVVMSLAPSVYYLIPARLIIGFASGLSSVVVPVYLGEIAPPTLRGTLGTCTQFAMVIGILVSGLLGFPLATATRWRYLFGVTPLLAVIQLLFSPYLLESPRWLLNRDESSAQAKVAIKLLRGFRAEGDVNREVDHYLFAAQRHKQTSHSSAHSSAAMWDLLCNEQLRPLLISILILQIAQQLCGINAVFYYSTSIFQGIISNPMIGTTIVNIVNVIFTYFALLLMDSTGRRVLLLVSSGGMLVSIVLIVSALKQYIPNWFALWGVMSFVSFFEIGLGPIPWLIVAEMFDSKYVATAMSLACIVNWGCNFLVGLVFPYLQQKLGPYSFIPFGFVLLGAYLFIYFYLPETQGRSIEEIHRLMGQDEQIDMVIQGIESDDLGNGKDEEDSTQ